MSTSQGNAKGSKSITPHDTTEVNVDAIWTNAAGNITYTPLLGGDNCVITVAASQLVPIGMKVILDTGTDHTAGQIIGLNYG